MKRIIVFIGLLLPVLIIKAQSFGDYRSAQDGDWNVAANWEIYEDAFPDPTWNPASQYPLSNTTGVVTILDGHDITIPVALSLTNPGLPLNIEGTGTLTVAGTLSMANDINLTNSSTLTVTGILNKSNSPLTVSNASTLNITSTGDFNLSSRITGTNGSSAHLIVNGTLDAPSLTNYIYGGSSTTLFPKITVGGTITTASYLNADTLIIQSGGKLTTSFYFDGSFQTQGWWYQSSAPDATASSIAGTVEFAGSTVQNIATLIPYTNLEISTSGTTVAGSLQVTGTLTINSGADLLISDDTYSNVNNLTITPATGGLVIEGTATGTGSLICTGTIGGSGASSVEVQHYQSGNEWHMISSPVSGYAINDFIADNSIDPNNANTLYAMMEYDADSLGWLYPYTVASPPTADMGAGVGYFAGVVIGNELLSYTGSLRQSNVATSVKNSGDSINCLGNPFAAALRVTADAVGASGNNYILSPANTDVLEASNVALWIYDPEANGDKGAYIVYSSTEGQDYLPVGQAFLAYVGTSGNFELNTDMQVHNNTAVFYKKSAGSGNNYPNIVLNVEKDAIKGSAKVYFIDNMTKGLDPSWDVASLVYNKNLRIYSRLIEDNGKKFYVQCLPNDDFSDMSVPIGLDANDSLGIVKITADISNIPLGCKAILEDRQENIYIDFSKPDASYTVSITEPLNETDRFFLHTFDPRTVDIYKNDLENIAIFAYDKEIYIQGELLHSSSVSVYDISGRMVLMQELKSQNSNTVHAQSLKKGIYIVHLKSGSKEKVSKLILN